MTTANNIQVDGVGLTFPNGYVGLKSTSIDIEAGTFCTLLGPSGSGKTTLLRTIAGLATPTTGRILIGGRDVTNLPIQSRNIGFVFQNYALFPHMTVAENIAYPLKLHKWSSDKRDERVREILDMIELPQVAGRSVGELSGGQQQRVAIGRALAYRPSLLLLDEPMGALDRRLRQQLGTQLREIQQRTGITAVYVTHDQEEAFILSDNIAIMERGSILQYDTPETLYFAPNSRFSAEFLGEINLIPVSSTRLDGAGKTLATTPFGEISSNDLRSGPDAAPAHLVVRPEALGLSDRPGDASTPMQIENVVFLGSRCLVTMHNAAGSPLLIECHKRDIPAAGQQAFVHWARADATLINH